MITSLLVFWFLDYKSLSVLAAIVCFIRPLLYPLERVKTCGSRKHKFSLPLESTSGSSYYSLALEPQASFLLGAVHRRGLWYFPVLSECFLWSASPAFPFEDHVSIIWGQLLLNGMPTPLPSPLWPSSPGQMSCCVEFQACGQGFPSTLR